MQYVSASEIKNNLSAIMENAKREPITVQKNGRDSVVIMAMEDYNRISNINKSIFKKSINDIHKAALSSNITEDEINNIINND